MHMGHTRHLGGAVPYIYSGPAAVEARVCTARPARRVASWGTWQDVTHRASAWPCLGGRKHGVHVMRVPRALYGVYANPKVSACIKA